MTGGGTDFLVLPETAVLVTIMCYRPGVSIANGAPPYAAQDRSDLPVGGTLLVGDFPPRCSGTSNVPRLIPMGGGVSVVTSKEVSGPYVDLGGNHSELLPPPHAVHHGYNG